MELSEAVRRSLRRGRTIDLHYEAISEEASFKSIMTSTGCTILLGILFLLPLALAGPALGLNWTIYLAWLIPPVLVVFAVSQVLRFGIRRERARGSLKRRTNESKESGQAITLDYTAFPVPPGPGPGSSRKLSRLLRSTGSMASNRFDSSVYLTS